MRRLVLLGVCLAVGCDRPLDRGQTGGGPDGGGGGGAADGGQVDGAGADGVPLDGGPGGDDAQPPLSCNAVNPPLPTPLRRLTRFEYNNSVRDLLGDTSRPADSLPPDGFTNDAAQLATASLPVDGYHRLAHQLANSVSSDPSAVVALAGCDPVTAGAAPCAQQLVARFVPRVLRRPLDPDDVADFMAVFDDGQQRGGSFASGARAVIEVALQSPEFLYRIELGEPAAPAQPQLARPTPYEMAARLSFLFWGSTPDDELLRAAAAGGLRTREEIAAQARRLVGDPRARDVVRYFYLQLMHLADVDFPARMLGANSGFTPEIAGLLIPQLKAFVDEVTWQGAGDFQALLTTSPRWVDDRLATFYGADATRFGLLTQPAVLASTSAGISTSPTRRGQLVLSQILCQPIPPPPPDLPSTLPPTPDLTTRERLMMATASAPVCNTCHAQTDPVGFAFEHYDAVGKWRTTENGRAIDTTGQLAVTDAMGGFQDSAELAARLTQSQDAKDCFVRNWMAFGYGRRDTPQDACSRAYLQDLFTRSGGRVTELLVGLAQTEAFLYLPSAP